MKINEEQSEVLGILMNLLIKLLVALSCIIAFWVILFYIFDPSFQTSQIVSLSLINGILASTKYKLVSHYFPAVKALAKPKTKPRKAID